MAAYTWDRAARRYRDAKTGRYVSPARLRELIAALVEVGRAKTGRITEAYLSGDLGLREWRTQMRGAVRELHTAASAAGRGGWAQMTKRDWGWVGSRVKVQYRALDKFEGAVREARAVDDAPTGRLLQRAAMYGESAQTSYHQMNRRQERAAGSTEERRYRGGGRDSCDTCIGEAARGWQPIGTLKPIGDSECITHCGCHFRYRGRDKS